MGRGELVIILFILCIGFAYGAGVTIEDGSIIGDNNLRIDNTTLYVQESTNRVGIGTLTPLYLLHVNGTANTLQLCLSGDCISAWSDVNATPTLQYVTDLGATTTTAITTYHITSTGNITAAGFINGSQLCIDGNCINEWNAVNQSTDTNATTACDDDEYLDGDGTCVAVPNCAAGNFLRYNTSTDTWTCAADSGGSGSVGGSGNANNISKWENSSALTSSQLYENGTNIGIGTTTPQQKLDIDGALRLGYDVTCTSAVEGSIRYNSSALELCNGSVWLTVNPVGNITLDLTRPTVTQSNSFIVNGFVAANGFCINGVCTQTWNITGNASTSEGGGSYSYVIAGDSGSTSVTDGQTVTIAGGTGITTSESSRTVTVNVADNYLLNAGDTASGDFVFNTNTLVINSTTGRVGINRTFPSLALDVIGSINGTQLCIAGTCIDAWDDVNQTATDTNASSACASGEFLNGDGTCDAGFLDADGTDDDTPDDDSEVPNTITIDNDGTVDADALGCDVGDDDLLSEDCIGDVLDESEIEDIFLLNSGDDATGIYRFTTNLLVINSTSGRIGVNTTDPTQALSVTGNVSVTNCIVFASGGQICSGS